MALRGLVCVMATMVVFGCGDDPPLAGGAVGGAGGEGGQGGAPPEDCPAGTIEEGEDCLDPGVPSDGCGEGFAHDGGYGCTPVVPEGDCGDGTMAVLGSAACAPVALCPAGPYGALVPGPVVHVDAFAEPGGDGSVAAPFTTIQAAVDAALPGGVVAIAAGSYAENVTVAGKALALVGRCPDTDASDGVRIIGDASGPAVFFGAGSDGSLIRGLTVTGASDGLALMADLRAEELWFAHAKGRAIRVDPGGNLTLRRVRIDLDHDGNGSQALVADAAVVDGEAIDVVTSVQKIAGAFYQPAVELLESTVSLTRSRIVARGTIDADTLSTVYLRHGESTFDGVYVHVDVVPQLNAANPSQIPNLSALRVDRTEAEAGPLALTLRRSLLRGGFTSTLVVVRARVHVDRSVIRELPALLIARGIECGPTDTNNAPPPAEIMVERSLLDDLAWTGVDAAGCDVTIAGSVVRGTKSAIIPSGISLIFPEIPESYAGVRAAVAAMARPAHGLRGSLEVRDSLFIDNEAAAIGSYSAPIVVDHTRIEGTRSTISVEGITTFGDGVALAVTGAFNDEFPIAPTATLRNSHIHHSGRAGVASFGGWVAIEGTNVSCSPIALHGQMMAVEEASFPYGYEDGGANACGCESPDPCQVAAEVLLPPPPLIGQ